MTVYTLSHRCLASHLFTPGLQLATRHALFDRSISCVADTMGASKHLEPCAGDLSVPLAIFSCRRASSKSIPLPRSLAKDAARLGDGETGPGPRRAAARKARMPLRHIRHSIICRPPEISATMVCVCFVTAERSNGLLTPSRADDFVPALQGRRGLRWRCMDVVSGGPSCAASSAASSVPWAVLILADRASGFTSCVPDAQMHHGSCRGGCAGDSRLGSVITAVRMWLLCDLDC